MPLVVLVRDFSLELEVDEKPVTADEYLEDIICQESNTTDETSDASRECIVRHFPTRKCFTLPLPVTGKKLKTLAEIDDSEIDAEFVANMKAAIDVILEYAQPMMIDGAFIKGKGKVIVKYVLFALRSESIVQIIISSCQIFLNVELLSNK